MKFIRVAATCLLFCISFTGFAQQDLRSVEVAGKYAATINPGTIRPWLEVLASPQMEGRETATKGQAKAASYIITQLREAGLKPGAAGNWEQFYEMYEDTLIEGVIRVRDTDYHFGEDFITDLLESKSETIQTDQIVFAGYGISTASFNDYANIDVKGKVVLIREGVPGGLPRDYGITYNKLAAARAAGVRALLVISPHARNYRLLNKNKLRHTGIYMPGATAEGPNLYYITPAMAASLLGKAYNDSLLDSRKGHLRIPVHVRVPVQITLDKKSNIYKPSNIVGMVEGSDKKDEYVFVTAHYDHLGVVDNVLYPGADDDGSGTAAVMAIASAFAKAKQEGKGPRRSVVFMLVSGEEKGLLGSGYYINHPLYPLSATVADLNIDMIGRIDPAHERDTNYIYIIGDDKLSSELRPINEEANRITQFKLDYKYNDPGDPEDFYRRSDHYKFAQQNIPVIFYFNGTHSDYHQPGDTVEKIEFELLARRAQLVYYTAWEIANRDGRLKVDRSEK
ncbi:M28 family peptidase [Chitinophaga sp. sic0106]|uniref:M28 family peptidase n=1 Tax=Chitinophaga sp. sic0106 TaxID=2854785 RepID=UPI001C45E7ED|nr:M28 family peptidase [Chitinophaga sp. sic0106]MBV7528936.1 M28 family peptidase [Chitinophaga sp. sic0106]